jgi:hypothetical protein
MKVASQHPETERESARADVKERLLLDGIALNTADVTPRHVQGATPVETHFANPRLPFWDGTTVPAGVTADAFVVKRLPEYAFLDVVGEHFGKSGHKLLPTILLIKVYRLTAMTWLRLWQTSAQRSTSPTLNQNKSVVRRDQAPKPD